jgi:two-component system KDP operon response regulator KdpE
MINMSSRPLRILVVDDDPAMVGAITALVGTEGHQVITAYDGLTAVKRFREEHPDLVLLDLAMPGPDGFNVAGQMRAVGPAPILIVSGESGEAAKVRALGLGADDYLTKPFGGAELLARLRALLRRIKPTESASGVTFGTVEVDLVRRTVKKEGTPVKFTAKEYALFHLLVAHRGRVLTHRQILREVWGPELEGQTHYLRVFMMRLRRKIEDDADAPKYLQTESGIGYRLTSGDGS